MLVDYKKVNIYQQADTPVLSDVDFHVDGTLPEKLPKHMRFGFTS